ncbi:hypothetical protein M8C21_028112 [Ambrosia artemisiifolia]|uniref:ABC transporter domain-containing protein n=1 Tax=Ambrosia artemisiifolia TaxID=4212 RepID=A0AAD5C941_AMBAR|nr:hypothetical protein M8C21_028112 [Ambrosia artemisiifolia]
MYGEVFVNGVKSSLNYGTYGFVKRKNTLIGSLTVREYLYYSALLQLPGFLCEKKSVVENAIVAMSLSDCANNLIGSHCCTKGLSDGEKRRVSIARELVMEPRFLFIDEPLYHLDSVSALMMMVTLKKLANTGCTLIFTIYQSSTEHFSNAGFPCPIMQSPSDHFLRAINTEFDQIISMCRNLEDDHGDLSSVNMDTGEAIRTLEKTYKSSADAAAVETMISRLTEREGPSLKSKGKASSATRITALTWRSSVLSIFGVPAQLKEVKMMMMLSAGYFRIRNALPGLVWMYPMSYIAFHTFSIQGILENEYNGIVFTVGQVRTIPAYEALQNVYDVPANDHSKWKNLMMLSLMVLGYRVLVFLLLQIHVKKFSLNGFVCCKRKMNDKT